MQATVWRFVARPGMGEAFEGMYGPGGLWAALFHESRDYHGTILLRDAAQERTYTLIDFWRSRDVFDRFKLEHAAAYAALDVEGSQLTEDEQHLGWFDDIEV